MEIVALNLRFPFNCHHWKHCRRHERDMTRLRMQFGGLIVPMINSWLSGCPTSSRAPYHFTFSESILSELYFPVVWWRTGTYRFGTWSSEAAPGEARGHGTMPEEEPRWCAEDDLGVASLHGPGAVFTCYCFFFAGNEIGCFIYWLVNWFGGCILDFSFLFPLPFGSGFPTRFSHCGHANAEGLLVKQAH